MYDDLERGCLLPVAQSGVTGFLAGALAYALARWQGWSNPGEIALIVAAAAALLVWASGVMAWRRSAYAPDEPLYLPPPAPAQVQTVRVELSENRGARLNLIDLPASAEQLAALARGLLDGLPFSEAQWSGGGGLFTRSEFAALRGELIRRGLARWNSPGTPARGAALTPAGRAVMRQFAMLSDSPPPLPAGVERRTPREQ